MSNTGDPVLELILTNYREKKNALEAQARDIASRIALLDELIAEASDGRSRLSRARRGRTNSTQPSLPEPGPALEAQP